jgi:hypothetical protein
MDEACFLGTDENVWGIDVSELFAGCSLKCTHRQNKNQDFA